MIPQTKLPCEEIPHDPPSLDPRAVRPPAAHHWHSAGPRSGPDQEEVRLIMLSSTQPPTALPAPPPAGEAAPLRSLHTSSFPALLQELGLSVLVTTYQA